MPYLIASFGVYLFFTETLIYWTHRALHHRVLYKWIHLKHHEFRKPIPFAGVSFNPIDSFLQALPHHLCALFLPIHVGIYLGMLTLVTIWAVLIHDRVSFVRWGGLLYTGHHTIHHHYNKYNFGQFFTFWDRWGGTYKSPHDDPERFLLPRPEASDEGGRRVMAVLTLPDGAESRVRETSTLTNTSTRTWTATRTRRRTTTRRRFARAGNARGRAQRPRSRAPARARRRGACLSSSS